MEGRFVPATMSETVGRQEPLIGGVQCRSHVDCPSKEHTKQMIFNYSSGYEKYIGTGGIPRPIIGRVARNKSPKLFGLPGKVLNPGCSADPFIPFKNEMALLNGA